MYVRGCEVQGMLDDIGKLIEESEYKLKLNKYLKV
jgi:hypothetical protein